MIDIKIILIVLLSYCLIVIIVIYSYCAFNISISQPRYKLGIIRFCPYRARFSPLYSVTQGVASLALG